MSGPENPSVAHRVSTQLQCFSTASWPITLLAIGLISLVSPTAVPTALAESASPPPAIVVPAQPRIVIGSTPIDRHNKVVYINGTLTMTIDWSGSEFTTVTTHQNCWIGTDNADGESTFFADVECGRTIRRTSDTTQTELRVGTVTCTEGSVGCLTVSRKKLIERFARICRDDTRAPSQYETHGYRQPCTLSIDDGYPWLFGDASCYDLPCGKFNPLTVQLVADISSPNIAATMIPPASRRSSRTEFHVVAKDPIGRANGVTSGVAVLEISKSPSAPVLRFKLRPRRKVEQTVQVPSVWPHAFVRASDRAGNWSRWIRLR